MKFLITGGNGFIGSNLTRAILSSDRKSRVIIYDNLSDGKKGLNQYILDAERELGIGDLSERVCLVNGDILDASKLRDSLQSVDVAVHLAASAGVGKSIEDPEYDFTQNTLGTFNVLLSCKDAGIKKVVFASSGAPLGSVCPPIHEELAARPESPYGASKLCGEAYCSAFSKAYDMQCVSLRFGNVYGPGCEGKTSVVAKFLRQALNGEKLTIYGDGSQTRDYVYVKDLVEAVLLVAQNEITGGDLFQVATNREQNILELVDSMKRCLHEFGIDIDVEFTVSPHKEVARNYSDTRKISERLGWKAKTSIDRGLQDTIRYLQDRMCQDAAKAAYTAG